MSVKMALLANLLSAMSCYIGLAIGIYIGQQGDVRFWIFAIAAGMFLYVALVDMVRDFFSLLRSFIQGGCGVGVNVITPWDKLYYRLVQQRFGNFLNLYHNIVVN